VVQWTYSFHETQTPSVVIPMILIQMTSYQYSMITIMSHVQLVDPPVLAYSHIMKLLILENYF